MFLNWYGLIDHLILIVHTPRAWGGGGGGGGGGGNLTIPHWYGEE